MSAQLSFFDEPVQRGRAPGRPATAPRAPSGRYMAGRGAELAAAKADRDSAGWSASALSFFLAFARSTEPGSTFAVEDVRHASSGKVPTVENGRAWGNVAKAARRLGQVEWAGYERCTDPKSHGSPRSAWRFIGERT